MTVLCYIYFPASSYLVFVFLQEITMVAFVLCNPHIIKGSCKAVNKTEEKKGSEIRVGGEVVRIRITDHTNK